MTQIVLNSGAFIVCDFAIETFGKFFPKVRNQKNIILYMLSKKDNGLTALQQVEHRDIKQLVKFFC